MSTNALAPSTGYVTAKPIAKFFSVSQPTIYRWADKDKIPCLRFEGTVRFDFTAVRLAIEEGSRRPQDDDQLT